VCAPKEVVDVFVVGELMDRGGKLNVLLGCCWTEVVWDTSIACILLYKECVKLV